MSCPPDRIERPVSRTEIAEHLADAFATGPASRANLLGVAALAGARDQLLAVLQTLPDVRYRRLQDLWAELINLPVEV